MQPLTAPPRDGLTVDEVLLLIRDAPAVEVTRGLEVLDLNLALLDDISDAFLSGTITRTNDAAIHGTCTLNVAQEIAYTQQLLRPYMTLTAEGVSARFNCGVYVAAAPKATWGDSLPTHELTGSDRLIQLNRQVGDAYSIPGGGTYATAILAVFTAAGIPAGHVRVDGAAANTLIPFWGMHWPLLTDPNDTTPMPVDAVADDQNATTWLRIINSLLAAINYRAVWVDWDGYFHCDPYIAPATRAAEFTFDIDDPERAIVAQDRTRTRDLSQVPNKWVFLQSNLQDGSGNPVQPVEGAGQYTVTNDTDGDTSIQARGGAPIGVMASVVTLDAADQPTLVALGDKQVAQDRAVATIYELNTSPFPAAWHEDIYLYSDAETGADAMKLLSTGWVLDFGDSTTPAADMQHTLTQVA